MEFVLDRNLAILVLNACYRASKELGEMGVMVGELCHDELSTKIRRQAGQSIAEIGVITDTIFKLHPELEQYVEDQIERFGRVS